jgi:hypothetical protein
MLDMESNPSAYVAQRTPGAAASSLSIFVGDRLEMVARIVWLLALALAPWLGGAEGRSPGLLQALAELGFAAAACWCAARLAQHRPLAVPRIVWIIGAAFAACGVYWALHPAPPYGTAFVQEQMAYFETRSPGYILQPPRREYLIFLAGVFAIFLTGIGLGASVGLRRTAIQILAVNALAVGFYGLGEKHLGWSPPPWLVLARGTEALNGPLFNHCGPSAFLDLTWPPLVFGTGLAFAGPRLRLLLSAGVVALVLYFIPMWHAATGIAIAVGVLVLGGAWSLFNMRCRIPRTVVAGVVAFILVTVVTCQAALAIRVQWDYPDHWQGVQATIAQSKTRDEILRKAVSGREDRLFSSGAPPRPVAWLTALRMAADHLTVGPGPGTWVKRADLYSNYPIVSTFFQHRQFAHHDLFQTAAEWGVVPAILCVILWSGAFWRVAPTGWGARGDEMGLLLGLLAMALHSTMHFPLQIPALFLGTAGMLGLAWATPQPSSLLKDTFAARATILARERSRAS